jgi:GxxExxY protein
MINIEDLTGDVIAAAMEVHDKLGPGLLESAYEACLAAELGHRGIRFQRQLEVPITYAGLLVGTGYNLDLLVEGRVAVEVRSVAALDPIFTTELRTYLKLGGWPVGLLVNFNVRYLRGAAIRRVGLDRTLDLPRLRRVPR